MCCGMIARRDITPEQRERAGRMVASRPLPDREEPLPRDFHGSLGEVVMCDYYGGDVRDELDYELLVGGLKVEVKTKLFTAGHVPSLDWEVSVPATSVHQRTELFGFMGLSDDLREAYVYGFLTRSDFFRLAEFVPGNEKRDGFSTPANTWRVKVRDLETYGGSSTRHRKG